MNRPLHDDELAIFSELRSRIGRHKRRNALRTRYVDGEERLRRLPVSVPVSMQELAIPIGWPAKTLQKFAARLTPEGYTARTTTSLLDDLEAVLTDNAFEYLEHTAIESAARHGCSFVFTTAGGPGEPAVLLTIRDAEAASVLIDPRTRRVTAALDMTTDLQANLHLPDRTLILARDTGRWTVTAESRNTAGRVLCQPYVHGATLQRPLGTSRITRPLMGLTDLGVRVMLRQEVSSEAYMAPRGFLIDVFEEQFEERTKGGRTGWENIIGAFSALASQFDDETGETVKPDIKFAPQMSFTPFSEQLRMIAGQVSGETSIPISYLGVVQDSNPTSAAAVEANEVDLIRDVLGAMPSLNLGRKALAVDVLTALHGPLGDAALSDLRGITPRWADPRTKSMSEMSQFVQLQVQAGNFQAGTEATLRHLPITPEEARAHAAENRAAMGGAFLNKLLGANASASPEAIAAATSGQTPEPAATSA